MSEEKIFIPEPGVPCAECRANPMAGSEDGVLFWCPHTRYGGLYTPIIGHWTIVGPFAEEVEFRRVYRNILGRLIAGKELQSRH